MSALDRIKICRISSIRDRQWRSLRTFGDRTCSNTCGSKRCLSLASNRTEYLALLVSREPPQVKAGAPLQDILEAVGHSRTDEKLFLKNVTTIKRVLTETYKLKLSPEDLSKIEYVYRTFWDENLQLRFSSIGRGNALELSDLRRDAA